MIIRCQHLSLRLPLRPVSAVFVGRFCRRLSRKKFNWYGTQFDRYEIVNVKKKKKRKYTTHTTTRRKKKQNLFDALFGLHFLSIPCRFVSYPHHLLNYLLHLLCHWYHWYSYMTDRKHNPVFSIYIDQYEKNYKIYSFHSWPLVWFNLFFFLRVRFVQVVIFHELPASVIVSSERPASSIKDERMRQSGAVASPSLNPNVFHRLSLAIEASSVARVVY